MFLYSKNSRLIQSAHHMSWQREKYKLSDATHPHGYKPQNFSGLYWGNFTTARITFTCIRYLQCTRMIFIIHTSNPHGETDSQVDASQRKFWTFRLATTCVDFGRAQIRRQVDTRWSHVTCKCAKFTTFCNSRADFWPPIPSPHASSGFANLRRLASPFGQGLRTSSSSWQQKNCHACVFKLCPCSTFYLKSWKRGCTLVETKLGWISQSSLVPLDPSVVSNTPKRKPGQFAYDMGNALVYIYTTLLSLDNVERLGKYV